MAEEKADQKAEGKENEKEEKIEKEDDPFAVIFDEEKETPEKEETEEEPQEQEEKKEKKVTPKKEKSESQQSDLLAIERRIERRQDVSDYLLTDAGRMFGQYAPQIRKAATDPRFSGIPIKQLAAVILTPTAYAKVLEDARKKADEEAADSYMGGTTGSTRTSLPQGLEKLDPTTMSKEEFAQLKADAKRGKYAIKK